MPEILLGRRSMLRGGLGRRSRSSRRNRLGGIESLERRMVLAAFTVNSLLDTVDATLGDGVAADSSGQTTLRAAIMEANALAGNDTVNLPAGVYNLTIAGSGEDASSRGDLDVHNNGTLTISGGGSSATIIDAQDIDRVFQVLPGALLNISNVTIQNGNSADGAGITNFGTLNLNNTVLYSNSAQGTGGAIWNVSLSSATIGSSFFIGNSAHNGGGGIRNQGATSILNSTFSANTSNSQGGGIFNNSGSLSVSNSTISGNSATFAGGGIDNLASLSVTNSTIFNNSFSQVLGSPGGGGVRLIASATFHNTIVAGNSGPVSPDVSGSLSSTSSNNLIGDGSGVSGISHGVNGNQIGTTSSPINPLLGPLANNRGPTMTHALLVGSPAIDAGNNTGAPATDQRGFVRPLDGDDNGTSVVDIGAFELFVNHPPLVRIGPFVSDYGGYLTVDASQSFDPDAAAGDRIVSYEWDLDNNGTFESSAAGAVYTFGWNTLQDLGKTTGTSTIALRVTDSLGATAVDTAMLTIYNNRPFARFKATPIDSECGQPVAFDATASSHGRPDRQIVSYRWDFGDGTSYSETALDFRDGVFDGRTTHAYGLFGSYMVNLAVTDNNNPARGDADSLVVNVNQGNHPPIADAGGPYDVRVGEVVTLDGSRSSDPDAACGDSIVAYEWDLNQDGVFDSSIVNPTGVVVTQRGSVPLDVRTSSPTFQYHNENWDFGGSQTVRLRVSDMFGRYQSDPYAETTIRLFNNLLPTLDGIDGDDAIELDESAIALPNTPAFDFDLSATDLDSDQTLSFSLVAPTVCPPGVTAYDPNDPAHTSVLRIEVFTDSATPGTPPDGASSATGTLRIQPGPNAAGTWCFGVRVSDNAGGHEATNTRPVLLTIHRAAPTIASFSPDMGAVGTLVTINGTDLSPVTDVKFGGTSITDPVEVLSASSIRVAVPLGAVTGPITVTTPAGTATTSAVFKVLPKITSFSPTSALVGETVTIVGTNFTGATAVKFGAVLAPVVSNTYSEIVAQVPATAPDTSKISVQTADGVAISVADFVVIKAPTISSFTPTLGTVGTLVTINGTNLSSVTDVMFGNVSVTNPIQFVSPGSIKVTVPTGAVTGKISVTNRAGTALSVENFIVAPKINTFTPTSGLAGTMVTIVGTNFTGATEVRFGTVAAAFTVDSYSQITAQVPATPPASTRIQVVTADGVAISDGPFEVLPSPPVITGNSVVQAGLSIDLTGDSSASQFRYHQWTWTNAAGATVTIERDTAGSAFVSEVVFSAAGFSGGETRVVTLQACSTGYGVGTCVTTTRTITVTPAPAPAISGPNSVQAGLSIDLTGDSSASQFRYHEWRWLDASGATVTIERESLAPGFTSSVVFSATGFSGGETRDVTLRSWSAGFGVGNSATATKTITVTPAPAPAISGPNSVQAGLSIDLTGDSSASRFRYHQWTWTNAAGATVTIEQDTLDRGFVSQVVFSAAGFSGGETRVITLQACSAGYGVGTCVTTTRTITIFPGPVPTISGASSVQAGLSVDLAGDSSASQFRYHEWRWTNATGAIVATRVDSFATEFTSHVTFSAAGFSGGETRDVSLQSWSAGFGAGSSATATRTITITPAPAPTIHGATSVQAGLSIDLTGDSSASQFRYHEWRWTNAAGATVTIDRDTAGSAFVSAVVFSAAGFSGGETRVVTLQACSTGYGVGTCVTSTRTISITPNNAPVAHAGGPYVLEGGHDLTVNAGASFDPDNRFDIITGAGPGAPGGHVKVFDGSTNAEVQSFFAYPGFAGGVRVASGDVNGDGFADHITGAGPGAGPHVKVFDGRSNIEIMSFFAYDPTFTGGIFVAAGDVNGDGRADIVTGADEGLLGGHVKVFDGRTGGELNSFFAYPGFSGGVRVATGDVNGDGRADIITGAGPGAGPHVKVFDGRTNAELMSFFAYGPSLTGGIFVAAGDLDGDGRADIVTGADSGADGGHVKAFSGRTGAELRSFLAYPGFSGGVRVAAGDVNGDGFADIVTGAGPGAGPHVKVFEGRSNAELSSFFAYGSTFSGGVYVAAGDVNGDRIVKYDWDLNNDGLYEGLETSPTGSVHTFVWDSVADLGVGTHSITLRVTDSTGQSGFDDTTLTIVDTTPPETFIDHAPPVLIGTREATFEVHGSDLVTAANELFFEYSLDGELFRRMSTASTTLRDLSDGEHTFVVHAVDKAGNADPSPAEYRWRVDATPPDTTITSAPPAATNSTTVQFRFEASIAGATFECKLDNEAFRSIPENSIEYVGLSEGQHTFTVRAKSAAGTPDPTPATYTWVVDRTPPDTTITSGPPQSSSDRTAFFTFEAHDAITNIARVECSLDDGPFIVVSTNSIQFGGLSTGPHVFKVFATDSAGNADPTPAEYPFTVTAITPDTTITSCPPALTNSRKALITFEATGAAGQPVTFQWSLNGGPMQSTTESSVLLSDLHDGDYEFTVKAVAGGVEDPSPATCTFEVDATPPDTTITSPAPSSDSTSAEFSFAGTDASAHGVTFQCSLDDGPLEAVAGTGKNYAGLSLGSHKFKVFAVDLAGNKDETPAEVTWTIDATPPDTTITSAPPELTNSNTAQFRFEATKQGATFQCSLDNEAFAAAAGNTISYADLQEGQHTFQVRAVSPAGVPDPTPAEYTWVVDRTGPATIITSGPTQDSIAPADVTFTFTSSEPQGASVTFQCQLDDGPIELAISSSKRYPQLSQGPHTFTVFAVDRAGNKDETPAMVMFEVDATGPVIDIAPPSGTYRPGTTFTLTVSDALSGIDHTTLMIDGVTKPADNPQTSLMQPGTHTLVVTAIDRVGNMATQSRTYTVTGAAVVGGHLVVVGSDFDDTIDIRAVGLGLNVVMNGVSLGLFPASVTQVIAYGLNGNDTIRGETLRQPLRFDGGDGDDVLIGGRANDILIGGRGNDRLAAGLGRDFLIGGLGRDILSGAGSILVNGTTAYDGNTEALELILQAWENPGLSPAARMAQIQAGLGSAGVHLDTAAARRTVFDDGDVDTLVGQFALDWFFAELGRDTVIFNGRSRPPINPTR